MSVNYIKASNTANLSGGMALRIPQQTGQTTFNQFVIFMFRETITIDYCDIQITDGT